ncbi:MAG: undecaprenyl-diphosphatase UppP [Minisyncoccia bacterium]
MDYLFSTILGLVQGLTEFIPVSSTGHLIIVRSLLGLPLADSLSFDAVIQLASAFSVIFFFWRDIWRLIKSFLAWVFQKGCSTEDKILIMAIIVGTIPAIILGLLLEEYMDTVARNIFVVATGLILGSFLFYFAEKTAKQNQTLTVRKGLLAGFFQCLALFPGMSRSGSTISGGLFLGLSREAAVKFSFLLSLPIILGSGLKKLLDIFQSGDLSSVEGPLLLGSIVAFVSGFFAIKFLISFLKNHTLMTFAYYRVALAILLIVFGVLY